MDSKKFIEQSAYIIKRACQFNMKSRKQGIAELGGDIDADALKNLCVFEFGIRLLIDGFPLWQIEKTLSCMIYREPDLYVRRLKTIQKEAVMRINEGAASFNLLNIIFSFFNDEEKKALRSLLAEKTFKEYFDFY